MKAQYQRRVPILLAMLIFLTACMPSLPSLPTAAPPPTMDATVVAVIAEATVTAMAATSNAVRVNAPAATATPSVATATMAVTEPVPVATLTPVATLSQPADFWVFYLLNRKINAMNADGAKTALLTNTPGIDYLPTWSPNGQSLAFLRFDGSSFQEGNLYVLSSESNTPVLLDETNRYVQFTWTNDSQQLLATRGFSGDFDVYLIDIATGKPLLVASDSAEYPRLSPDGMKIALLLDTGAPCKNKGCRAPNDLYLYDIPTRQTTRLTGDTQPKMSLAWSPDGQQIAYYLYNDPNFTVDILRPDGTLVAAKQPAPWWASGWIRSPDGSQVAYFLNDMTNGAAEIFTRPVSGGEARRVIRVEKRGDKVMYIDTLRWRPDSSGFVFNLWTEVYTVNQDGSGLRALPVNLENVFFDVHPVANLYQPLTAPTAPATWKLCPGGLDSRLDVGRRAQVSTSPPSPNNVRAGPMKTAQLLGQIQPGEKINITNGPYCDQGLTWWEIRSLDTGIKGYTLEGDLKTYWLVPLP